MTYSRTLNTLTGTEQQQIKQLRNQLLLVQEETEDMIRELQNNISLLSGRIETIAAQIEEMETEE